MKIRGACNSNIGCREINQDAVLFRDLMQGEDCFALCAVCDGVGGLEHGELASGFLKERIESWFEDVCKWMDAARVDTGVLFSHLKDAAELWNEELWQQCQEKGMRMGSTMSLLMIIRDCYYIVHVGDSRVYRCRRNVLEQLTEDASVARMRNGRVKNYLSNYMGREKELQFQSLEGTVEDGDLFMVCSDGFYHYLTDGDILKLQQIYKKNSKIAEICSCVIGMLLERGERDNISLGVVVAQSRREPFGRPRLDIGS